MTEKSTYEALAKRLENLERDYDAAQKALRKISKSEALYRVTLENISDTVIITDDRGTIIYACPNTHNIFGLSQDMVYDIGTIDGLVNGTLCDISELKEKKEITNIEWTVTDAFQNERSLLINVKAVSIQGGSVLYVMRDITERKTVERDLAHAAGQWQTTFDAINSAIWILDKDFTIERANETSRRMFHLTDSEMIGRSCCEIVHGRRDPPPECPIHRVKKSLRREHSEIQLGGRWFEVSIDPVCDGDGGYSQVVHIMTDITEQKAIAAQLNQRRKMESIGTLTGGIAHDFNNILYMITGSAELALEEVSQWSPVHEHLKDIKAAGFRAAGIVKNLISSSRHTEQQLEPIGAVAVINNALNFLRSAIPATIEIRKHLPQEEITILADPIQMHQVLMNICINAVQAMAVTGGMIQVDVSQEWLSEQCTQSRPILPAGHYINIEVRDTGPGIDPCIVDRIFDPYFSTKDTTSGSGMGLAVVHGIIRSHGGSIDVQSEPGKGAIFTTRLPIVDQEPEARSGASEDIPRGTERIIFVDDEPAIVKMAKLSLERLGYRVETNHDPRKALERFRAQPEAFDLVISDMTMPEMTGVRLSEKIKAVRPDVPVIICTGHSALIDEERGQRLGISAYVRKPLCRKAIAKIIRKVLDGK